MGGLITIAEQLDVARRLMDQPRLDIVMALSMLNALPPSLVNDATFDCAREAVLAVAMGTGQHLMVARHALTRVIVPLEQRIAKEV